MTRRPKPDADDVEALQSIEVNRLDILVDDDDIVTLGNQCRDRHERSIGHGVFEVAA